MLVDLPILEGPGCMKGLSKRKMFLMGEGKKNLEKSLIFGVIRCLILFLYKSGFSNPRT